METKKRVHDPKERVYFRAVYLKDKSYAGALCPVCGEIVPNPDNKGPQRHMSANAGQ